MHLNVYNTCSGGGGDMCRNIRTYGVCKYLKKVVIMAMSSGFECEAKNSAEAVRVELTTIATACYLAIVTLSPVFRSALQLKKV